MPNLLDQLREQRATARTAADEILTRAATEQRDLTPDEFAEHTRQVAAEREAADAMEAERDRQLAEVRAMATRGRQPTLSRASAELARQFRSAIYAKNPQPIEVFAEQFPDEWPNEVPEPIQGRAGRVIVHTRDTLKSTATQALSTNVYSNIVMHLVETSSLMRAGATVVTTATGEDLVIPKSTGFVTSAIIPEGTTITESDPTLATVTLKAFKYANYFEISQELANDTPTNLLDFLARQAALSLGLGTTGYGDDLINGTGTTQPRGLLLDAGSRRAVCGVGQRRVPDAQRRQRRDPQAQGHLSAACPGPDRPPLHPRLPGVRRPVHAGRGQRRRVHRLRRHVEVLHPHRQRHQVRAQRRIQVPGRLDRLPLHPPPGRRPGRHRRGQDLRRNHLSR